MTASELASHVNENWKKLTGLPVKAKHREGEFPDVVLELVEEHGVSYLDFCDEWTMLFG